MKRLDFITTLGLSTAGVALAPAFPVSASAFKKAPPKHFKFCLNTSTISGAIQGAEKYIDIAARAGYEGIELWTTDVKQYKLAGKSMPALKKLLADNHLIVENAITFAPWLSRDDEQHKAAFQIMKEDMELMAEIGCRRIAAPPSGEFATGSLDLVSAGQRYKELLDLGRTTGVMPQLEFWGSSAALHSFGQALQVAAAANDPDVHILPDVFHLFRGNSGFDCLKVVNGNIIDVIHMNDYAGSIPWEHQQDGDRVYPGDGIAPFPKIIAALSAMEGTKVLSLELFNRAYWDQDPLLVAKTGLSKMKALIK